MSSRNPVSTTAIACAAMALAATVIGVVAGHPRAGLALGAGLLIGAVNSALALRGVRLGGAFLATSLGRLGLLSCAGLAAGLALGVDVAWVPLVGLGLAQFALAAVAMREAARA